MIGDPTVTMEDEEVIDDIIEVSERTERLHVSSEASATGESSSSSASPVPEPMSEDSTASSSEATTTSRDKEEGATGGDLPITAFVNSTGNNAGYRYLEDVPIPLLYQRPALSIRV